MTAKQKVDYAIRQVVVHHDFFGPAVMAMPWQECDHIPTACTNGTIVRYNPEFIDTLSKTQTIGLVIHELMHPMLNHLERLMTQFKTDSRNANIAADYEINNFITSYNRDVSIPIVLPPDGCINVDKWGDLCAEVIYKRILEEQPEDDEDGEGGGGYGGSEDSDGDGSSNGDGGSDSENNRPDNGDASSAGEFELPSDPQQAKENADKWREILGSCIQTAKLRGKSGSDFLRKLEGMFESPISLEDLLSKYITEFCIGDASTRPDRKFLAMHDICISGIEDEKHGTLVFVRDTSGSIDDDTLRSITSVIQHASNDLDFERIAVIDADARVCDVKYYDPQDTISLEHKGGGGTDFVPALKYVEDEIEEARVVIYLTDGYGRFPNHEPSTPTLWITYGLDEKHFPFGDVVNLSEIIDSH